MKCGGGSDMMKNRKKTLTIIQHLSECLEQLPFSIKARAGLNEGDKEEQADFLLQASTYCSKISIHGRTLKQLYSGAADWDFIQQVKREVCGRTPCEVIGNGGITSYEQAKHYNEKYQVDGIMIGQAAIGNPRIFTPHQPTKEEKLQTILRHLDLSIAFDQSSDPAHSLVEFRKFLFQYVKGIPESRERKTEMLHIKDYDELKDNIEAFFEKTS